MSKKFDKDDYKKDPKGRSARQADEGYDNVKTGSDPSRFQGDKQVLTPDELSVSKDAISKPDGNALKPETLAAKELKSKIKIRPDVSVDELEGKQVGGVPLVGAMGLRSVAGVSAQSPADDMSKTPYSAGKYRPETRYGKKRSEDLFLLDNQVSEQVVPHVDDALDLREAPEAKMGYNGRKQFKQTRGKKNFKYVNADGHDLGKLPQQLLNEASVDLYHTNKVVYTSGQMITGTSASSNVDIPLGGDYPTVKHDGASVTAPMHKGNYRAKELVITTALGKITNVSINEDAYQVHADPISRDQANMNMQVDINNVAKSVIRLQNELGRETTDKWSPLGYVIEEPYQYNMLMHDIEATTGAVMATAYRAAVSSMAYQRNIAGKDGVNPQRNAIKMILDGYAGSFGNSDTAAIGNMSFKDVIWKKSEYQKGSVAGIIEMFDSIGKYRTKADILGLQRSLSLHLSQCDNNLDPLHVKPEFLKALDKAHMFSTPTGQYNPYLPVFSTRKISLITPLSLNNFLVNWKNPALLSDAEKLDPLRDISTGTYAAYSYSYSDIRNRYTTRVQNPLIEGILRWLLKHEGAFVTTFGDNATIHIPMEFNFEAPSLFEFLLCSASQDVLWERNITFRDVLFAGEQDTYVWDDLAALKELDPLFSTQLKINDYTSPLTLGKLAPDTIIREMWGNHISMTTSGNGKVQYMLPWYFNEVAYFSVGKPQGAYTVNEGFFNEDSAFNFSIPSIRDGVRHEYVDAIKSMEDRDIRLSLDRYITIPTFITKSAVSVVNNCDVYSNYNASAALNNYIKLAALRYDANSDGRMIATYDLTSGSNRELGVPSLYCVPREIGYIDDDYYLEPIITSVAIGQNDAVVITTVTRTGAIKLGAGDSGYAYNGASPVFITSYRVSADSSSDGSIDRAAALNQIFYNCYADSDANVATVNQAFINKTGIIPCLSYNDGNVIDVYGVYNLGSNAESTSAVDKTIRTIAPRIWSMLQRFFMPVNVFENTFAVNSNVDYDPLETCFYFGLCGTLASDYTQDVLERLDAYDQLGMDYTKDVFSKDSLILR